MMFAGGPLKVVLATVHVPLMGLWGRLNIGAVFQPIELMHQALVEWFDIPKPRIAVARRQPARERERAVRRRGRTHHLARDPHGPRAGHRRRPAPIRRDTVFLAARDGKFDAVVAMYHDQGLIPVKLLAFDQAVNVTLGLPIIRTSPDHGTAFDIVGRNRANPGSHARRDRAGDRHGRQKARPQPKPPRAGGVVIKAKVRAPFLRGRGQISGPRLGQSHVIAPWSPSPGTPGEG